MLVMASILLSWRIKRKFSAVLDVDNDEYFVELAYKTQVSNRFRCS